MIEGLRPDGVLHMESLPGHFWSTTNVGEALPGVVTPLGWSIWGPTIDIAIRRTFARLGALEATRLSVSEDPSHPVVGLFYGRSALNVNFLCAMGSRLPGSSSEAIAVQLLGAAPAALSIPHTIKRLPAIALRLPYAMVMARRDVLSRTAPVKAWWSASLARVDKLDLYGAQKLLAEAREQFQNAVDAGGIGVFIAVQPIYDQLTALIKRAGLDSETASALMAGQGSHAETDMVADLWELGRGGVTLEEFLARHGYHGPHEGEVSAHVWREDPGPVKRLADQYASRDTNEHPAQTHELRIREREAAERTLLANLPAVQRPLARLVLKVAVQRIALRGVAKAAFLQSLDVVRAAVRGIGILLAEADVLADPDDAFFLTADELIDGPPTRTADIVAQRSALYTELRRYDVPNHWQGDPDPIVIDDSGNDDSATGDAPTTMSGIGASGGIVEGPVRIVTDPAFGDIEPGEILVCQTTDPSWASVMFLADALVADIGGLLSHAAVVARELGVPCVVGTGNCMKVLRTGDVVRVDGYAGTVELIDRPE